MAITYDQSASLMNDMTFRGRVKVACLKFANFIIDEATTVAAHNTRYKWAQNTLVDSDAVAGKVVPNVVMDPAVQSAGSAITDAALQTATETAIQDLL
jgi:hypothetical protein